MRRDAVNFVVGSHDATDMRFLHGRLEGNQKVLSNDALGVISRRRIRSALGLAVDGEMLHRRHHMMAANIERVSLKAGDCGHGHSRDEIRIFSVSLFGTAPTRIARKIKHWRKYLTCASRPGFVARCRKSLFD